MRLAILYAHGMHPVETYLAELWENHALGEGTGETSHYAAIQNLLRAAGHGLAPKVVPVAQLKNRGAGYPDFGLFTQEQIPKKGAQPDMAEGVLPSRGVVEVKAAKDDSWITAEGEQVSRYWGKYGQVLVTNYRDFVFIGTGPDGKPRKLETFRLAEDQTAFWNKAKHARKTATEDGDRLVQFLERCLIQGAPLSDPKALAALLAAYAWEAKRRVGHAAHLPALDILRKSLEQSLGIAFDAEKGEDFFHSSLVQTLFYGVFSAWVSWCETAAPKDRFRWKEASWTLHVPMVKALFGQLVQPDQLNALGLVEVLDWAQDALNRVDRSAFFKRFQTDQAVQYFYEPFLEAFDPELRKQLGVWYTPREIVRYMVSRVDTVLREELGLKEGLAHPSVHILDPCCGTGAFLVEVAAKLHESLKAAGEDAMTAGKLKKALLSRVHGFELLPAPFVVSHLQLGLMLQRLGAPLVGDERLGVYLTNSLTGWEPPTGPKAQILMPELEAEREAADQVKREIPILVILGNPPYSGFPGIAKIGEERDLSSAYRATKRVKKPEGHGLNDLYVRFFRMAERKIADWTKQGVVCFTSNYSWLDGLSHTGMREALLERFDGIWVDNLHGDRIISEYAPDGRTSETVFAIQGHSAGIKIGTAISLLVRKPGDSSRKASVSYRDFHEAKADERREALLEAAQTPSSRPYTILEPSLPLGLPLKLREVGDSYLAWPSLPELFPTYFPGVKTSRDAFLVDVDREALETRLQRYFDPSISHEALRATHPEIMTPGGRYEPGAIRDQLRKRGLRPEGFVRYAYRPMDVRWLYWEGETKLLDEKRPEYAPQVFGGNVALVVQQIPRRDWAPPQLVGALGCLDLMDRGASFAPLLIREHHHQDAIYEATTHPNLSAVAQAHLKTLGAEPTDLFFHSLAILHAPLYRTENAGALRQDWPRVPLPPTKESLTASAALGLRLAALLDVEQAVPGVSEAPINKHLVPVGRVVSVDGSDRPLKPGDTALRAGWGIHGKGGITMPGKGRREGERVYLNDRAWWDGINDDVWTYSLGGYPVLKKWLSYREEPLLGRALRDDEVEHFKSMARRIAAILAMGAALEENYRAFTE